MIRDAWNSEAHPRREFVGGLLFWALLLTTVALLWK